MRLFDSVPKMAEMKMQSLAGDWYMDTERCADLAASCKWLDIFAEENGIEEECMTVEIADDMSVVISVRSGCFIIDRGRSDPLYLALCGADDLVFRQIDEDTADMELRFDSIFVHEKREAGKFE